MTLDNISPSALTWGGERWVSVYQAFLAPVLTPRQAGSANLALPVLALQSGGQVLRQTGSLPQEIALCLRDLDTYYTITFALPPGAKADEYHAVAVTVDKSGLTARTDAGYYAEP